MSENQNVPYLMHEADMAEDIRAAMPTMPEDLKRDAQRFLSKLEQM